MTSKVVLAGFGPHVRFTTKAVDAKVRIITAEAVKTVPLRKDTDLTFAQVA